jgi:2-polyprenyl-3-methyl-5-hydroxy-6-metoxy-1,4-benzoquinol methylase
VENCPSFCRIFEDLHREFHIMSIDEKRSEAFAERMMDAFNSGALCLMTSIGHRTGLFDVMEAMKPATSEQIAEQANLNERYVREWLGAMTSGKVIECDPESGTYSLPPEHAAWLTRAAAPNNMAVFAQYTPLLGQVEEDIIECFRQGGGVPYERYPRFHEVMAEESGQTIVAALEEHILPLVPNVVEELTNGIRVLDVGCGSGRAVHLLASLFPRSEFVGYDLSPEAIGRARDEAREKGLANANFEERDLTDFHETAEPEIFDFVTTFDAVHDQAKPLNVLKGIANTLKMDGTYLMQDIGASSHHHENVDHPIGPFLYTVSCMHCMTVSLAQSGEGLGAMWGRQTAERMLREAGFGSIEIRQLEHDIQNDYYIIRK